VRGGDTLYGADLPAAPWMTEPEEFASDAPSGSGQEMLERTVPGYREWVRQHEEELVAEGQAILDALSV
jgi:hypothetical protein